MANGTISGDTTVAFKQTLLIPAVDLSLANGSQNVKLLASSFPNQNTLQLSFLLPSLQVAGQVFNLVVTVPMTLPQNFVGSAVYCGTQATANAVFTVVQVPVSTGVAITQGTVTVTPVSHTSCTLVSAGVITLLTGDVLQIKCPTPSDITLADIGITLLATRS